MSLHYDISQEGRSRLFLSLTAVVLAGFVTGLTGFGFSVLAVPLLILVLDPRDVVIVTLSLAAIASVTLLLSPGLRGRSHLRVSGALALLSLVGMPIGLYVFEHYDTRALTILMGVVIVGYAATALVTTGSWRVPNGFVWPSGLLGGLLAPSTGLSGPAVVMFIHGRRITDNALVATMSSYVAIVSTMGLALLWFQGQVHGGYVSHILPLIPGTIGGVILGRRLAATSHRTIDRIVLKVLVVMGLWTIVNAFGAL